jgi:hypothetical protein
MTGSHKRPQMMHFWKQKRQCLSFWTQYWNPTKSRRLSSSLTISTCWSLCKIETNTSVGWSFVIFGLVWLQCTDATISRQLWYRVQAHTWTNLRVKAMSWKHPDFTLSQIRRQNKWSSQSKTFSIFILRKRLPNIKMQNAICWMKNTVWGT